ncbi:MAG: hypothetical protein ACK6DP_04240 [Gemmatimonas sp.]|uniref:hypothetical protein n=1 Tax=Gemmatimonas sp. TaxID=1962908 RepID=UPI00391F4DA4|nr:hypothetical protein [Gemmatimonadota bacterium]
MGITTDLTASILAAAGVQVPGEVTLDGVNLLPILEGNRPVSERTLFWRSTPGNRTMYAVRRGDYKLVIDANHLLLFNVRTDPGERTDLAREGTDVARDLRLELDAWEKDVDAEAARRTMR